MKIKITKKQLYNLYWNRKFSACKIAELYNCSSTTIYRKLKGYSIKIRKSIDFRKNIPKKYLVQEYTKSRKSMQKIAKTLNCHISRVWRNLLRYNIHIRTISEATKGLREGVNNPMYDIHMTGEDNKNFKHYISKRFLISEYINYQKSLSQIAEMCNCGSKTIRDRLVEYNIPRRTDSEGMKIRWSNLKYRMKIIKATLKGLKIKPNKPEKYLGNLLNRLLPNEYDYVGDGKIFIAGFVPDFINCNGQKKIIELYGDYWHNRKDAKIRDKKRIKNYIKYGYKTLIIWEHELRNLDKVKTKILIFNNTGAK